jgi:hypothetical protein
MAIDRGYPCRWSVNGELGEKDAADRPRVSVPSWSDHGERHMRTRQSNIDNPRALVLETPPRVRPPPAVAPEAVADATVEVTKPDGECSRADHHR